MPRIFFKSVLYATQRRTLKDLSVVTQKKIAVLNLRKRETYNLKIVACCWDAILIYLQILIIQSEISVTYCHNLKNRKNTIRYYHLKNNFILLHRQKYLYSLC